MQGYLRQAVAQIGLRNFAGAREAVAAGLDHAPGSSSLLEVQSTLDSLAQARQRRAQSRMASTSALTPAPGGAVLEAALASLAQAGAFLLSAKCHMVLRKCLIKRIPVIGRQRLLEDSHLRSRKILG
jgi:hypothetical protein